MYCGIIKKLAFCLVCAVFLTACGAKEQTQESGVVQDIEPGQKSVIDSPAPAKSGKNIEERDI